MKKQNDEPVTVQKKEGRVEFPINWGGAWKITTEPRVSPEDIAQALTKFSERVDRDLLSMTSKELSKMWLFRWNHSESVERNIYDFTMKLSSYRMKCQRWDEHHNGPCSLVERVRDRYLWPKIEAFAGDMRRAIKKGDQSC